MFINCLQFYCFNLKLSLIDTWISQWWVFKRCREQQMTPKCPSLIGILTFPLLMQALLWYIRPSLPARIRQRLLPSSSPQPCCEKMISNDDCLDLAYSNRILGMKTIPLSWLSVTAELGRDKGGIQIALNLSCRSAAGETRLLNFFWVPADQINEVGGRKVQLGCDPGSHRVVPIFCSSPQF